MNESNYLVERLTALCFTASSAVHECEFVYDFAAVISSISHFSQLELVSSVVRHGAVCVRLLE
jgi:hypothetical protein